MREGNLSGEVGVSCEWRGVTVYLTWWQFVSRSDSYRLNLITAQKERFGALKNLELHVTVHRRSGLGLVDSRFLKRSDTVDI